MGWAFALRTASWRYCSVPAVPMLNLDKKAEESVAKGAVVSQELANKFRTEKDSPYLRFVRNDGLDIIGAHYVQNLRTTALKP